MDDKRGASSGNRSRNLSANVRNFKTRSSGGRDVVVRRGLGVGLLSGTLAVTGVAFSVMEDSSKDEEVSSKVRLATSVLGSPAGSSVRDI